MLWVVGLPVHLDGRESDKSREARRFGQWLAGVTSLPVELFDERFTSVQAEELLMTAELTSKQRKQRIDKLAAQIMLSAISNRRPRAGRNREVWTTERPA